MIDEEEKDKNLKRWIRLSIFVCFCMMILSVSAFAQSEESGLGYTILEMNCEPKIERGDVAMYFSASVHDVYKTISADGIVFRVKEFTYDKKFAYDMVGQEQFLIGFFFDDKESAGRKEPIKFPIAKGRKENFYWNEDGKTRSRWFIRSKDWLCGVIRKKR